ncbi:MAG: hypothetical protein ACI83P_001266 [Janthinobacterium sp.]|jgi:hypothetical protein
MARSPHQESVSNRYSASLLSIFPAPAGISIASVKRGNPGLRFQALA